MITAAGLKPFAICYTVRPSLRKTRNPSLTWLMRLSVDQCRALPPILAAWRQSSLRASHVATPIMSRCHGTQSSSCHLIMLANKMLTIVLGGCNAKIKHTPACLARLPGQDVHGMSQDLQFVPLFAPLRRRGLRHRTRLVVAVKRPIMVASSASRGAFQKRTALTALTALLRCWKLV